MKDSIYIDKENKISIFADVSTKEISGLVKLIYSGDNIDEAINVLKIYQDNKINKLEKRKQNIIHNVNIAINRLNKIKEKM